MFPLTLKCWDILTFFKLVFYMNLLEVGEVHVAKAVEAINVKRQTPNLRLSFPVGGTREGCFEVA